MNQNGLVLEIALRIVVCNAPSLPAIITRYHLFLNFLRFLKLFASLRTKKTPYTLFPLNQPRCLVCRLGDGGAAGPNVKLVSSHKMSQETLDS